MAYSGCDMADYSITYNLDSQRWILYSRLTEERTDLADIEEVLEAIRVDLLDALHKVER